MDNYSPFEMILAIALIVVSTFVTRSALLVIGERVKFAPRVEAALRYAPVYALAALVAPEILLDAAGLAVSLDNPRLPAALAASLFLLWKRSIVGCIAVGMTVFALWRVFVTGS